MGTQKPIQRTFDERCEYVSSVLQDAGNRLTKSRREAIRVLCSADAPMSIQDLHEEVVRTASSDLSTQYRLMNELQRLDLVKAVEMRGQPNPGYVVHLPGESNDLLVCTKCGQYAWLEEAAEIRRLEERIAKKMKFGKLSHELRLNGVCEPCQETPDPA
ncbi:MAG: hypothetical protein CMO80_05150 [Verrucomicrobiales bacterium]|nr:hypothetical protein [Verrucomicrobiales bacterium]|tara:strand:- start:536 stop:1012 length:477 start_codon:yes stop_codon:yes gene_type:complete